MSEAKEPVPQRPVPDADGLEPSQYDTPMWRAIKKGVSTGALVGFLIATYIAQTQTTDTPIGAVYEGNVLLLFGGWVGLGALVGVAAGWLSARKDEKDAAQ